LVDVDQHDVAAVGLERGPNGLDGFAHLLFHVLLLVVTGGPVWRSLSRQFRQQPKRWTAFLLPTGRVSHRRRSPAACRRSSRSPGRYGTDRLSRSPLRPPNRPARAPPRP